MNSSQLSLNQTPALLVVRACVLSCFSRVRLCATPGTTAHQAPLSMGFSRQEYWSGLPCLLQGIFSTQGLNLHLFRLPALAGGFWFCTTRHLGSLNACGDAVLSTLMSSHFSELNQL